MNKTTEALKLSTVALKDIACTSQTDDLLWWQIRAREALAAIREALAEPVQYNRMTDWPLATGTSDYAKAEPVKQEAEVSHGLCGGCAKKAADGWALYCVECWEKAEPVKQKEAELPVEPVAWRWPTHNGYAYAETHFDGEDGEPLYAEPVQPMKEAEQ